MFTDLYNILQRSISMATTSIEERLRAAQVAIGNALADPALLAALEEYSYNTTRLQQGNALRQQAWMLYQRQKGEYGELSTASHGLEAAQQQARASYMRYVKMARLKLEDDRGASQKLGLTTGRKRPLAKWLAQAQQFYTHALSDAAILGKLAEVGITRTMLEAGQQQVDAVGEGEALWRQRQGAARDATRVRDEAIAALDAWMRKFTRVARVAFEDRPQLLEQLGIKTRGARAATHTPGSTAGSEVAFDVEATTPVHDSAPPAPERRNGHAMATSR
jgi:hypothetical protein